MHISEEMRDAILDASMNDATKIIRYLEEQECRRKKYDRAILAITLVGATGSVIAAVTGILLLM